jgi:hypothetical protein
MRTRLLGSTLVYGSALLACSPARPPPPPAHSGWTLRYTQRVGEGSATARDVRPDVAMVVLDGAARMNVRERGIEARLDPARADVTLCHAAQCTPTDEQTAFLAIGGVEDLPSFANAHETDPQMERLDDPLSIVNVPTQGARFVSTVHAPTGDVRFTVEVRWIDEPGERSVEVVKRFFLAPLVRMGAAQLVDQIRHESGLPLHWEVRIATQRRDGSTGEGSVVYHAAEMGNAPAAL